jgi:aspartate/methionine/tyrosine aminotransferase
MLALGCAVRAQIQERVAANLGVLKTILASHPDCELLQVEGGWYATVRVPRTRSEEEWCLDLLNNENVLVQPGFFYDFESEAYLVLSLLPAEDVFAQGVRRIWTT